LVEPGGDEWNWVPILSSNLVEVLKSTQSLRVPSFFLEKRTGALLVIAMIGLNPLPSMSLRNSQRRQALFQRAVDVAVRKCLVILM